MKGATVYIFHFRLNIDERQNSIRLFVSFKHAQYSKTACPSEMKCLHGNLALI